MKKTIVFIILIFILCISKSSAQSVNDYRSVGSGNWTNIAVWEVYNGSAWVAATTYPGEVAGTNDISIEGGFSITISSGITNSYNSLTIGDGIGSTDTLLVSGTSSFNTSLITVANGGYGSWTSNVSLSLPAGAAFIIEPGGSLDESKPCSAAKRLIIGSTIYATCNGGAGADFSFEDLNDSGGSLNVTPGSNSPICVGETLNLFANPAGAGSGDGSPPITYNWSATGPGGYSFSSTTQNPTVTGLNPGTYTYTVQITYAPITHTNSVEVTVDAPPDPPINSTGNPTVCIGASIPALTATVNTGETIDWYDASTGGNLLASNNTSYTPLSAGSYYAEAKNISSNCVSATRLEIILTTVSCTVITNRNITYRVQKN